MLAIKNLRRGAALAVALVAFGALGSCTKAAPEAEMVQKVSDDSLKLSDDAVKNVTLQKVIKGEFPERLSLMGKISVPEDRVAVVPARVSGRTDAVYVASGDVVVAEQPLASIFSADFTVAREEYLQAVRDAKANPQDVESARLLELSRKKLNALGVSTVDIAKWNATQDALQNSGPNPSKTDDLMVRAPRGGALLGKNAMVGGLVNVGDTMFMIGDMKKVWFAGDIYPEDLRKIHKNQEVIIDSGNGAPVLHGKISFISPVVDPTSRTIKVRALVENPGNQLRADMYVQGDIILSTRTALVAPKSALVNLRDITFCFKRLPGNIFKRVSVRIDGESGANVAVAQGLDDGDMVVSEGALLLDAALNTVGNGNGAGD